MTLFTQYRLLRSGFGPARHRTGRAAAPHGPQPAATLSRAELLREVIAVLG